MAERSQTPPKKKLSRTCRWAKIAALVIVALVLLAFLATGLLMLWGSRRIRREIEAVKALHEPTNWDELLLTDRQGHVVPAADNAAEKEAASLYSQALSHSKGWNEALSQKFQTKLGKEALSAEEVKQLGEALSQYQAAIGLFRKGLQYDCIVTLPAVLAEPSQAQFDEMHLVREGARLLRAQAFYYAARGRAAEAADTCVTMLHYARVFPGYDQFAGAVGFSLWLTACRTIEQVETLAPSPAVKLDTLIQSLHQAVDDTPLPRILCGERVCCNYLFESGWVKLPRFSLWPNHAAYLEVMRESVAISRDPFPISLQEMDRMAAASASPPGPSLTFTIFAHMCPAAMNNTLKECAQAQARIRATLVSLAIRRARLDGMPLPAKLQELVPKYLSAIPTDPFTGEPLRYRSAAAGCTIYSVGPDGVDNGGEVKAGVGSDGRPAKDIGVQLER